MQITFTGNNLLADDILNKAYQEKLKASDGTSSAQAAGKDSGGVEQAADEGDVVAISEEARRMQGQGSSGFTMQAGSSGAAEAEGEEAESGDLRASLRQQIREVQKQLSEARERLSMAKGRQSSSTEQEKAEEAESEEGREAAGAEGGQAAAAATGLEDGGEVEKVMAEISQLNNTLTTLNQQLMQEERKSAQSGAAGTAGISTGGTGRGGAGERLAVRA